jgi:lipopolysaccharide export system permease protein
MLRNEWQDLLHAGAITPGDADLQHRLGVNLDATADRIDAIDPPTRGTVACSGTRVYNVDSFHYHPRHVRLLDRYLLRELFSPFWLGLAIFTSMLLVARILKLMEMVVSRGVPLAQILKLFSYILPAFLEVTVPMALLLAVLVAFGRLSTDSETVALQASGISIYRLMVPVAAFALATAILTFFLSLYVRPWGNSLLRTGLYEIVKARASAGIKAKVFNDEFGGLVVYVDQVEPLVNRLYGVLIADTRDAAAHNTIYARMGILVTNEDAHTLSLRLIDGGIYTTTASSKSYQDTRFTTYDLNLDLNLAVAGLQSQTTDPTEMSWQELHASIADKKSRNEPALAEEVEIQRKFAIPFGCLVFAALGLPLGIRPSRAVHSRGFSVSLVLIFCYYLLLTLGHSLGERGALQPMIASWLPNILLSVVAATLLFRTSQGLTYGQRSLIQQGWRAVRTHLAIRPGK